MRTKGGNFMKTKKLLSIVLAILMIVSVLPLTVSAAAHGDFEYTLSGSDATITGYSGAGGAVNIPQTITVGAQEYKVTSIGAYAFWGHSTIKSVTIPEGVTSIGRYAFGYCSAIESISLPESLVTIGEYAFSFCTSLKSITIPANVSSLTYAFDFCTALNVITVDENNQHFASENGVLFNKAKTELIQYPIAKADTYYAVPDSVVTITRAAFQNANKLTKIDLHDGITTIGSLAFSYCEGLTTVTVPKKIKTLNTNVFLKCTNLESVSLPHGLQKIDDNAFSYCTSLKSIDIPDSVTNLGNSAFNKCHSLESIVIPASVSSADQYVISECDNLKQIVFADGTAKIHEYFILDCPSVTDVVIPASVASIGYYVFNSNNVSTDTVFHYAGTEEQWVALQSSTDSQNNLIADAIPHYITFDESKDVTCTEDGYKNAYVCEECGPVTGEEITPAIGHKYMSITTKPTCAQDGYVNHVCLNCGDSYVEDGEEAFGHNYGEWKTVAAPSCKQQGVDVRICETCGASDYRTTDTVGHSHIAITIKPTCTQDGYTNYICDCGDSYIEVGEKATGHSYGEWEVVLASSCKQHGIEIRTCVNCNNTDYRTTPTTGHAYTKYTESESAKCGQNAKETASCDYGCGATNTREVANSALTHTDADKDGYCDHDGTKMNDDCSHVCHSDNWFNKNLYWPIIRFFWKLFNINPICDCGVAHY